MTVMFIAAPIHSNHNNDNIKLCNCNQMHSNYKTRNKLFHKYIKPKIYFLLYKL